MLQCFSSPVEKRFLEEAFVSGFCRGIGNNKCTLIFRKKVMDDSVFLQPLRLSQARQPKQALGLLRGCSCTPSNLAESSRAKPVPSECHIPWLCFFPGGSLAVRSTAWYGVLKCFHSNDSDTAQAALTWLLRGCDTEVVPQQILCYTAE